MVHNLEGFYLVQRPEDLVVNKYGDAYSILNT